MLDIRNLDITFGTIKALSNVSTTCAPGRVTAIVGPNASGKSTLLRAIASLLKPDRGTIVWNKQDVRRLSDKARARTMSFVPQHVARDIPFTVRENIALGQYRDRVNEQRIDEVLGALELGDVADRLCHALSGGQQQRTAIARSMAQGEATSLRLFDEPTSGLDHRHIHLVMQQFRALAARGATVLLSLHDLNLVARWADDVLVLKDGHLVASGRAADVLTPSQLDEVFEIPFRLIDHDADTRLLITD